jgi:hypothetical protein
MCLGTTPPDRNFVYRRSFNVSCTTPRPTKLIKFKSLKVHYMFQPIWPSSGVKTTSPMRKLLPFVVAANTYAGPSDAHVCWSWCLVLLLDVFFTCPVPETSRNRTRSNNKKQQFPHRRYIFNT